LGRDQLGDKEKIELRDALRVVVEKSLTEMKLKKHENCFMARSNAPIVMSWGIEKTTPNAP
jgi:hypothetical protein